MSNRDSLGRGDLIPQDVVDILAQEKHSRRSLKKRSNSLGRALGWLKGKKRQGLGVKRGNLSGSPEIFMPVDALPAGHHGGHRSGQRSGRQAPTQSHAVLKLEDEKSPTPPLLQENVFIESSRPKYLENLHSEALEGLKMMQQEESNNGVDCKDNESTVSAMTVHTDGEGGGFITDSTIGDTTSVVSVQSSVSTRSSRSGLTRQDSTFRPLNSGKKSEKGKTRKRHRKTIGGIPQHVQMELGLDRGGWALGPRLEEEEVYNGETDDSSVPDGPLRTAKSQRGAEGSSRQRKATRPLGKGQIEQLAAGRGRPMDDMALLHSLVPDSSEEQRPQSLAVPWMTTANSLMQKPPSPVMSMSPQAAYMSKIIPNAVLPPSIDVVEISRGRSRNSVRTVSHGSLLVSSPATSRPSSRACSSRACSSRASTANPQNLSDNSCWSTSGSTETLVSDSSTVSSSTTPRQMGSQDGDRNAVLSSSSRASHTSNGLIVMNRDEGKKEGPFGRSLSVMKPKKAPPPPSRSYSLYNKMKRRSRDLTGVGSGGSPRHVISVEENKTDNKSPPPSPSTIDSPGYNADTSSLEDSTSSASFSPMRALLPGPKAEQTARAEAACPKDASQGKRESAQSKVLSPSSGYSSQDGPSKPKHSSSARHKGGFLARLQRLFPGSTSAVSVTPPPPVPELSESTKSQISVDTSSVSPSVRALIELFNIPPPPKVHAPPPPPPEVWAHSKRTFELLLGPPAPDNICAIMKKNPKDRRQRKSSSLTESAVKSLMTERKQKSPALESANGSPQMPETQKGEESAILNGRRTLQKVDLTGSESVTEVDGKVRVSNMLNGFLVKAVEKREERLAAGRKQEESTQATARNPNAGELPAISFVHISPPVPLPQPPPHATEVTSLGTEPVSPDLSWPPPPPPVGVSGPDELELPLPPPPVLVDGGVVGAAENFHPGGGTSLTSSLLVVEAESDRGPAEAEPQKASKLRGNSPLPPNIPPPPPYTAPPPPVKAVYSPPVQNVSNLHLQEVSPSPHKNDTPPPPSVQIIIPPPPPPPKAVVTPPPPPKAVIPPPPKAVTPPPPPKAVTPPPPPKAVTPPPPPPPKAVTPPPPPKAVTPPPPPKAVTPPPPPKSITPPPPPKSITPPPAPLTEASLPPPTSEGSSPPPQKDISPPSPVKVSPPPLVEAPASFPAVDVALTTLEQNTPAETSSAIEESATSTPTSVKSSLADKGVSPLQVIQVSTFSTTEVGRPCVQENVLKKESSEYVAPPSIPPAEPSQLQLSGQNIFLPHEEAGSEANQVSFRSILTPPQSIPPAPPTELLHQPEGANTDGPAVQEFSSSATSENSSQPSPEKTPSAPANVPLPPSLPGQDLSDIKQAPRPASTEDQSPQVAPAPAIQVESTPFVSPSLLQTAELQPAHSSSEAPQVEQEPDTEVIMRKKIPASSSSAEAPPKPVRRSLIINSPSPSSPPATVTSQPPAPKSEPLLAPPVSSTSVPTLTIKSPPAASVSPSMNLQEAIRLRTAARSLGGPSSLLNSHSPASPPDLRKSPSSTASFIFAKSSKKVVVESKPVAETKAAPQKNRDVSSPTRVDGETEPPTKVPPPVAKKPKTKGKENETSHGTDVSMDNAEKTNGTAGTVEQVTPST